MSGRFPVIPESALTDVQRAVHAGAADIFSRLPHHIEWKNDEGLILGPYSPLFYTDDISQQWFDLAFAVTRQKRLSLREKELVILAVLSQYDAPYLRYAHSEIAVCIGFSKDQVQDAFHGKLPGGLSERESTVFDLALNVTKLKHPMDDETFEKARVSLTRDEIAGVAHIVSGYIYVAILANIGNGYVPKAQEGMFQASKNPSL